MEESNRREFLKSTGATLAGSAILASRGGADDVAQPDAMTAEIPPHRSQLLDGVHAYTDQLSVAAGQTIRFCISSTHAANFEVCRLGADVDSPAQDDVLRSWRIDVPKTQPIHPGSYLHIENGLSYGDVATGFTVECWGRLWDLESEQAIVSQYDRGLVGGFALVVNRDGQVGFVFGDDNDPQKAAVLWSAVGTITRTETSSASVPGVNEVANGGRQIKRAPWHHVVATFDGKVRRLWVDGKIVAEDEYTQRCRPPVAPLRIGASGENGEATALLDADIALPAVYDHALSEADVAKRFKDHGLSVPDKHGLLGCWALDEEKGAQVADSSGHGRHATLINHGTWMIGGPSFNADVGRFTDYEPKQDSERGHGLRLASDDLYDCRWQPTIEYRIPETAQPGIYVGRFRFSRQGRERLCHSLFIVRKPEERPKASVLFVCATNSWRAYSGTPFAESWAGVKQSIGHAYINSPGNPPEYSFYWHHKAGQGTCQMGLRMPWPVAGPYTFHQDIEWECSHLCHADRLTMSWMEKEQYDFDVVSDLDVHQNPDLLQGYKAVVIAGHSEYWSAEAMDGVERYYRSGGNVLCFSGNSMYWRVSFSDDGSVMECRKSGAGGSQIPIQSIGEIWHSHDGRRGSLSSECGYPSWKLLGLQFLSLHAVVADGVGPYRIIDPDHFLFNEPHALNLKAGDRLGEAPSGRPSLIGHEGDVRISSMNRLAVRPLPAGATHPEQDPSGITLLAEGTVDWSNTKLVGLAEDYFSRPCRQVLMDQKNDLAAEMIYWEREDGGKLFNAGSVSSGRGFAYDEKFGLLVKNVLHHFGVPSKSKQGADHK